MLLVGQMGWILLVEYAAVHTKKHSLLPQPTTSIVYITQQVCIVVTSGSAPVTDPLSANARVVPQAMPPNLPTRNSVASKSEMALPQK